jgi:hypothetical protein
VAGVTPANVLITGGESITDINVQWVAPANALPSGSGVAPFPASPAPSTILVVRVDKWGDFAPYTLRLVNDAEAAAQDSFDTVEALTGFDPQLAEVCFSFKVECGPEFDCLPTGPDCTAELPTPPPINYLAKDFGAFKQVMLDRMGQLLPGWTPNTEADLGVALAEVVAYAADQLSYRQDAVATEAYISTARSRISLRRHALLVDYRVHEGCNARVWMQLTVGQDTYIDHKLARFYTSAPGMPASLERTAGNEPAALVAGVVAFEPMQDAWLYPEQNTINFYTWGDGDCCLPKGATAATLAGTFDRLKVGDVLIFREMVGPETGSPWDADVRHRCAVRLTAVATRNAAGATLVDPLFDTAGQPITSAGQTPQPVTEIQWSSDDALPFPVCVSSTLRPPGQPTRPLSNVSVAFGNVVLADQGLSMPSIPLGVMPGPKIRYAPNPAADRCQPQPDQWLPVRFRPKLPESPLTQAAPLTIAGAPAGSGAVPLPATGWVALKDKSGVAAVMASADAPLAWPQYFGVETNVNGSNADAFDLAVVFDPPGGPAGMPGPVKLEQFIGLTFTPGDPNYAPLRLAASRLIRVPTTYTPPATPPADYPSAAVTLPNSGSVQLLDETSTPFLTLQPNDPRGWPPLFSLVADGEIATPGVFNLLVFYAPSSGAGGGQPPVLAEQFTGLTAANIATTIDAGSDLISVISLEGAPDPALSAADLMDIDASVAVPAITLQATPPTSSSATWTAVPDLLAAGPEDQQFVVETDSDGSAYLRFGDGTNGMQPPQGTAFTAAFRIGNGTAGNVGADSLVNFAAGVAADATIQSCTNPLPASGGIDPETNAQIRRRAPQAFLTQERAITMTDYVNVVEQNPQVEDAAATARWTGSWYTVFVTAEPKTGGALSKALQRALTRKVNQYRLAGQDTLIEPPQYIGLDIQLEVCVDPDYFRLDVQKALAQVLGSGTLANGQPALFTPGSLKLGQTVYLSPIYRAARTVPGVQTVRAKVFEPQGQNTRIYLRQGFIPMGPFQVARMDNDPSLPRNGRLGFTMEGGR